MSEEPIKVVNFDGFISHVSDSGEDSEVIIYVAHVVSDDSRMRGGSEMGATQDSFVCGNHVNNSDDDYGIFTIRVGKCVERVAVKDISENGRLAKVRLIDKGIDVEVERNALFPSNSRAKIDNDCMCPILVVDAGEEQREVAAQISGRECRCINGNLVVIPSVGLCVKGRLLISYGNGGYAELKDISLAPTEGEEYSKFVTDDMPQSNANMSSLSKHARPFRYRRNSITRRKNYGNDGRYEREEYSGVMDVYENETYNFAESRFTNHWNNNPFNENSAIIGNNVSFNRRNYSESFLANYDHEEMDDTYAMRSRLNVPYKQSFFKEYVPHVYPRTIRIRFDKIDSSSVDTFWAFEPSIFTTVERVLHEGRQRYIACPQFDLSLIHELSGMGCLVRASVDSAYRSLYRAEIIKFSNNIHKFSVYLVDYGFYKWIKYNDVFDISVISKRDKILYLPVALLHCRLEKCGNRNGIRLQQLEKGSEYEITIKSRDSEGIFNVNINEIDNNGAALTNICDSVVPFNPDRDNNLLAPSCSCSSLQFIHDVFMRAFQRNMSSNEAAYGSFLMSTMMASSMTFNNWPSMFGFGIPYPMIMPIMVPVMPDFGNITNGSHESRICAQYEQSNDTMKENRFSMNRNMRGSNRRGNGRSLIHEEGRYHAIEHNGELNYSDNFDEYNDSRAINAFDNRNNHCWGRRGERNGAFRGRRPRKYIHINAAGSDEAHEYFSFDAEFSDFSKENIQENTREESIVCAESSEWDLPPLRNQRTNRLTGFYGNNTSLD
ncbi:Tudor domain family protein [Acanthocheilonema viteae]